MSKVRMLGFDPNGRPKILVEMEVSRIEHVPAEGIAQIWEYVGDYEVGITFPSNDGRVKSLVELHRLGEQFESSRNSE